MQPDIPLVEQDSTEVVEYLKEEIKDLCESCGKKVKYHDTAVKVFSTMQRKYKQMTPMDIECIFNEVIDGKYGVVAEMKFHFSTINVWLAQKNSENNIDKTQKAAVIDRGVDPKDYSLDVWKLFEEEPNSKYCFPVLYAQHDTKTYPNGDALYTRADNILVKGINEGLVINCVCNPFKGHKGRMYLTKSGLWHCPHCGRKIEDIL